MVEKYYFFLYSRCSFNICLRRKIFLGNSSAVNYNIQILWLIQINDEVKIHNYMDYVNSSKVISNERIIQLFKCFYYSWTIISNQQSSRLVLRRDLDNWKKYFISRELITKTRRDKTSLIYSITRNLELQSFRSQYNKSSVHAII